MAELRSRAGTQMEDGLREAVRGKYAEDFRSALTSAGFEGVEIRATHRVHEHASAAIIRARKPRQAAR